MSGMDDDRADVLSRVVGINLGTVAGHRGHEPVAPWGQPVLEPHTHDGRAPTSKSPGGTVAQLGAGCERGTATVVLEGDGEDRIVRLSVEIDLEPGVAHLALEHLEPRLTVLLLKPCAE